MRTMTILTAVILLVWCQAAPAQMAQTPLSITDAFNQDGVCGPAEFRVCITDGTQDLVELFGNATSGNLSNLLASGCWIVANGYGPGHAYSIPSQSSHPAYLSGNDGLPTDGVLTGADRLYHVASLVGNGTLAGNWTETADPSDFSLQPNCVVVGSFHSRDDWQIPSVIIELPAAQKLVYQNVNFILAALDSANLAMNMRIVALYGPDGTDEAVLYTFSSGPQMDEPVPAGFLLVHPMGRHYSSFTAATGAVRTDKATSLFEFDGALALDDTKTLWGFRIEDTDPTLNWASRGLAVLAATATRASDALAFPTADAGADQAIIDNDEDGFEDVQLDGAGSMDSDGVLLTHIWTEGPTTVARGIAPAASIALGSHTITLTVTDEDGLTDVDTVQIDINPIPPGTPIADAGPDQSVADTTDSGDTQITLDGSGSSDADGTIVSWDWTEAGAPIASGEVVAVTMAVGIHNATLTVTDNDARTRTDTVTITVKAYTAPVVYHVNAATGDDANTGDAADPFATISMAASVASYGDTIIVHDGIYRESIEFNTSGYDGSPITLRAADGETPILSGADEVTGWAQCTSADATGNPNYANIHYADIDWKPTMLFADNAPLTKARTAWMHPADGGTTTSLIDPTNITEPSGYWTGAETFMWIRGGTVHFEREILSHAGSTITFTDLGYGWTPDAEDFYWLQNKVELIDEPGDWAVIDNDDGTYRIFAWCADSADPNTLLMEASTANNWLIGWNNEGYWIIDGLEIRHNDGHGLGGWTPGGNHITIRNCSIHHNNGAGIYGRYNDYGHYYRNYIGHNAGGAGTSESIGVLVEENEIDTNTHDGITVNGDDVILRRNYIHGHWMWGHADNAQTWGDVENLLFDSNLILNGGQSIMMEGTDGVTYANNAIVGCHGYMVIAGHNTTYRVTLDGNTLMFPGYACVNSSGDIFDFVDNIWFTGKAGGAFGVSVDHTHFASDYNLFYTADGFADTLFSALGSWGLNLAGLQSVAGLDMNSLFAPPQFVNAPVSYHMVETDELLSYTPTRVYVRSDYMAGLVVGDHIELDFDGVVRTITAVGANYIEFDVPKPEIVSFKAGSLNNWKTNTDFTLDLSVLPTSPAIGLASDGGTVGSTISVPDFMAGDFDGDGVMDVPRWNPGDATPAKFGDADGDGDVDLDDFVILKQSFGQNPLIDDRADFDGDGDVDLDDFVILKQNFGT